MCPGDASARVDVASVDIPPGRRRPSGIPVWPADTGPYPGMGAGAMAGVARAR